MSSFQETKIAQPKNERRYTLMNHQNQCPWLSPGSRLGCSSKLFAYVVLCSTPNFASVSSPEAKEDTPTAPVLDEGSQDPALQPRYPICTFLVVRTLLIVRVALTWCICKTMKSLGLAMKSFRLGLKNLKRAINCLRVEPIDMDCSIYYSLQRRTILLPSCIWG